VCVCVCVCVCILGGEVDEGEGIWFMDFIYFYEIEQRVMPPVLYYFIFQVGSLTNFSQIGLSLDPPTSVSHTAGVMGTHHHIQLVP
jgi:hypothetical protein